MKNRNQPSSGSTCDVTRFVVPFLVLLFASDGFAQSFSDDFIRPNSPIVGNGWLDTTGNVGGNLGIVNNQVSPPASGIVAGIYRPTAFDDSLTINATLGETVGFQNSPHRYGSFLTINNNGGLFDGYGLRFGRADAGTNDSSITLYDGQTAVQTIKSSFEFGSQIQTVFTVHADGRIFGTVTGGQNTSVFSFGPRSIQSQGINFSYGAGPANPGASGVPLPRLANIELIRSTPDAIVTVPVIRPPASILVTLTPVSATALKIYNPDTGAFDGTSINRNAPTVVLTHGFQTNSVNTWLSDGFAATLHRAEPNVNVLAWDWREDANHGTPGNLHDLSYAASRTANQGEALATSLASYLGTNYERELHFIGHSLGALVNSQAINVLRGSEPAAVIQDTLLDEASIANDFISGSGASDYIVSPIPAAHTTVRIDNYVSAFGTIHREAANIILQQDPGTVLPRSDFHYWTDHFHNYPINWYQGTIEVPSVSSSGFAGAIERPETDLNDPVFRPDTYLLQNPTGGDYWQLKAEDLGTAAGVLVARDDELTRVIDDLGVGRHLAPIFEGVSAKQLAGAVQHQGKLLLQMVRNADGQLTPHFSLIKQQVIFAASAKSHVPNMVTPQTDVTSSSYAWVPLAIPDDAQYLSLDFAFHALSPGDFLSIGIDDVPLLQIESRFVADENTYNSGLLDVANWRGQTVELFLGLCAADDSNSGGSVDISNIAFGTVPDPALILPFLLTVVVVRTRAFNKS